MDHPQGIERVARLTERAEDEKARQKRFKLLYEAVRLEPLAISLEQRQERGEALSFWDQVNLKRWREIRGCLQGELPTQP